MKKIIFVALIIGATKFTQAQSNLVFNRVLNFNLDYLEEITVPEGKVWKVEEVNNIGNTANELSFSNPNPEVGNPINNGSYKFGNRPIWFEEGVILKGSINGNSPISILEFDVVPVSTGSGSGSGGGGVSSDGLVFSSVINLEFNVSSGTNFNFNEVGEITVPEGKIWKVVSASSYRSTSPSRAGYIKIAGNLFNSYKSGTGATENKWNLFLSSGTYYVYTASGDTINLNRTTLNILEYEN